MKGNSKVKSKPLTNNYNEDNWPLSTTQLYQPNSIRHNSNHKPILYTYHSKMMQLAVVWCNIQPVWCNIQPVWCNITSGTYCCHHHTRLNDAKIRNSKSPPIINNNLTCYSIPNDVLLSNNQVLSSIHSILVPRLLKNCNF